MKLRPGISVLIASQNVEETLALCIRSFLPFGDELVIVDNGSNDLSKDIARDFVSRYPKRVRFYDVPELPDLYHNRQYALEHSSCQWVVRADADFVAYDGILELREHLLSRRWSWPLVAFGAILPNITGDFWHTGIPLDPGNPEANAIRHYIPPPVTLCRPRIYRRFPGFRFQRTGRWEGVRFEKSIRVVEWKEPLWMHCNLKDDRSYFFRSERTNWREQGDFARYPTLLSYIESLLEKKYGTTHIDEAARIYMRRNVFPYLERYNTEKYFPYPSIICDQMERNAIYRIEENDGLLGRHYFGPPRETDEWIP